MWRSVCFFALALYWWDRSLFGACDVHSCTRTDAHTAAVYGTTSLPLPVFLSGMAVGSLKPYLLDSCESFGFCRTWDRIVFRVPFASRLIVLPPT